MSLSNLSFIENAFNPQGARSSCSLRENFFKKSLTISIKPAIIYKVKLITDTESWLSWSKAHDWKSCIPYKGIEGSNPSLSARKSDLFRQVAFSMKFACGK